MKKENIMLAIQSLRTSIRQEVRKEIIEETNSESNYDKRAYAEIASYMNFLLHDVEEIRRIALVRSGEKIKFD